MKDFTLKVGVVGAGAVGPVLGAAFLQAGHHLVGITARSEASRERVEAMLPQTPVLDIEELLSQSDLVLFCVRDGELRALVEACALAGWFRRCWNPPPPWVRFPSRCIRLKHFREHLWIWLGCAVCTGP